MHGGRWRIYWSYDYKRYEAVILEAGCDERHAAAVLDQANAALSGRAAWPPEITDSPAVRRYMDAIRPRSASRLEGLPVADIVSAYRSVLAGGRASGEWVGMVEKWIADLLRAVGGLDGLDNASVIAWLDNKRLPPPQRRKGSPVNVKPSLPPLVSAETRNKILIQVRRFCRWLRDRGAKPMDWDPVAGISRARVERHAGSIVILDDDEVELILTAADKLPDGIAVWIALLGGLRRGEIARLGWDDVGESVLQIRRSKTGDGRHAPLSSRLRQRLERMTRKPGARILNWPEPESGWIMRARRLLEEKLPAILNPAPPAKHASKKSAAARAFAEADDDGDDGRGDTRKRFDISLLNWNTFRHTYASRLVRRGMSLDTVADWMGNSPATCRRHYARFLPRSGRDDRIDLVD